MSLALSAAQTERYIQPFPKNFRTAIALKVFPIGLYVVVEADLELLCNS